MKQVWILGSIMFAACAIDDSEPTGTTEQQVTSWGVTGTFACTNLHEPCTYNVASIVAGRSCFLTNVKGNLHAKGLVSVTTGEDPVTHQQAWLLSVPAGMASSAACADGVSDAHETTWFHGDGHPAALGAPVAGKNRFCALTTIFNFDAFGANADWGGVYRDAAGALQLGAVTPSGGILDLSAVCFDSAHVYGPFPQQTEGVGNTFIPPWVVPKVCGLSKIQGNFTAVTSQVQTWWDATRWNLYTQRGGGEAMCVDLVKSLIGPA